MYFLHQIRINDNDEVIDKGIAAKDTLDAANQSLHAYLGAYGYGKVQDIKFVHCMITDDAENSLPLVNITWAKKPTPQPEPEE